MVRRALIALGLASHLIAPSASGQGLDVHLPACSPSDIDLPLVRELLGIELGDWALEITLGASLCDAARTTIDLDVRDPASGRSAHEEIALTLEGEPDPHAAARAVALAVAERAPRAIASVTSPPVEVTPPSVEAPRPSEPASALAAPAPSEPPRVEPLDPVTPAAQVLSLPPTLGIGVRARIAPVLPSWAPGLRVDVGASFDPTWSIRGEVFGTWTRATAAEGDADAVVVAAAGALGATLWRDGALALALSARAEAGLVVAMGWSGTTSTAAPSLHPWLALGPQLDLVAWLSEQVAFVADLAVSGVLYGVRVSTWPSGTQIDLSVLTIDVGAGVRIAL